MRVETLPLLLMLPLMACTGEYNQGLDPNLDKQDDTSVEGDADADADGDSDADADGDSDSDSDSDIEWSGSCGNYWDPIDLNGWTKVYSVIYDGQNGSETHTAGGEVQSQRYRYSLDLAVDGGSGYRGDVVVDCNPNGREGLYISEWVMEYTTGGTPLATIYGSHSDNRMYLANQAVMPGIGSWTYAYTLDAGLDMDTAEGPDSAVPIEVSGVYLELGTSTITFDGQSVTGYRLTNTYEMTSEGLGGFGGFTRQGYIDQTWVKGLGVVTEVHTWQMSDGSSHSMEKALINHQGLTAIP